jgi:hypothetical protein
MEEERSCEVLLGKPEEKRPLGIPRRRWEGGIRMDFRETGWEVWNGFIWPFIIIQLSSYRHYISLV